MNNEQNKIERIKKSCRIGKTACRVLKILCIVGAVSGLVGFCLTMAGRTQIDRYGESALIENNGLGLAPDQGLSREDLEDIGFFAHFIPASADLLLQVALVSLYAAIIAGVTAFLFHLFGQVFDVILREESPFTGAVMKKMRINFVLLAAVVLFTAGFGPAVAAAFLFWCVYNVFDYGCVLQQGADETL